METMKQQAADLSTLVEAVRQELQKRRAHPLATYRLEFHREHCTFQDAKKRVAYLAALGVSHVYASPYQQTDSRAAHGYAIVDSNRLNSTLGTDEDYRNFVRELHDHGLGQILDIVPNHMAAVPGENRWWTDVLENGQSSPFAQYFDIQWEPVQETLRNRILLPVLGQQFGQALDAGELQLTFQNGAFLLNAFGRQLPIEPRSYAQILVPCLEELKTSQAESDGLSELESILSAIHHLPEHFVTEPEPQRERIREKEVIKQRLGQLVSQSPAIKEVLDQELHKLNGNPADPASFDALEQLLRQQVYRLSHWKAASDEVNYRRFFDINELVAISTEHREVFEASHALIFELLLRGDIDGLRIDHVDGLYDPEQYLWRLQWGLVRRLGRRLWNEQSELKEGTKNDGWQELEPQFLQAMWEFLGGPSPEKILTGSEKEIAIAKDHKPKSKALPLYLLVEKILGAEEPLPAEWPIDGTSGYDFLNQVNGLFVDPEGYAKLRRNYARFTREGLSFQEVVAQSKTLILNTSMASELSLLGQRLKRLAEHRRHCRDYTLNTLLAALREVIVCFAVYRTYSGPEGVTARDEAIIRRAVRCARRNNPLMETEVFDFIRDVLLWSTTGNDASDLQRLEQFVGRFQQVTSPVMAKGVEDTTFYRYLPLIAVNEVGAHPPVAAVSVVQFHEENVARKKQHPQAMLTTSTHDTKRSEDVRARIQILSEIPDEWHAAVTRWARWNRRFRSSSDEADAAPSRNDEYLFYQTLAGVWPTDPCSSAEQAELVQRIEQYMEKATHEAKLRTSWNAPDREYDDAVRQFVRMTLRQESGNRFLQDFQAFQTEILSAGLWTAASQTFLKLMSPGVPDIYQGQEIWDFSLVDPDNRRPVDYSLRQSLLREIQTACEESAAEFQNFLKELTHNPADPRLKMFITWQSLQFRRKRKSLFYSGDYLPLEVEGERAEHVCAFAWHSKGVAQPVAIVVAPRLIKKLTSDNPDGSAAPLGETIWGETRLKTAFSQGGIYQNLFARESITHSSDWPLTEILKNFPLALLVRH